MKLELELQHHRENFNVFLPHLQAIFPQVKPMGLIPKYNQVFGFSSHKRDGKVLLPHFGVIT